LRTWQQNLSNLKRSLDNTKVILFLLEIIEEESIDLTMLEWNFKEALIGNLNHLLEQQRIYWKQRSKIGASAKLWTDNWSNVGSLCSFAPQLFAAISPRGKKMSLNDGLF